jgi:hypothetical protein
MTKKKKYSKNKTVENKRLTIFNEHYAEFKIKVELNEIDFTC